MYDENPGIVPLLGVMRRRGTFVFFVRNYKHLSSVNHTRSAKEFEVQKQ
jgi:hypothetical protein